MDIVTNILPVESVKDPQTSIEQLEQWYKSAVEMAQQANEHTLGQWVAISESRLRTLEQARQANGKT